MPVSQGSAGGLAGLNLKAWVLFNGDGSVVKSFNVTSVAKIITGRYRITFTTPMQGAQYVYRYHMAGPGTGSAFQYRYSNATANYFDFSFNSESSDGGGLLEFFE